MKYRYKVRFHLGKGQHYMHWRIKDMKTGDVKFFDPDIDMRTFLFTDCRLVNQQGGATKIFNGENKSVVAWIECDEWLSIYEGDARWPVGRQVSYNPRVTPHWMCDGKIVDKVKYEQLTTRYNKVYEVQDV